MNDAANVVRNLEDGNKVYSSTGKEYFIRPKDKDQMDVFCHEVPDGHGTDGWVLV